MSSEPTPGESPTGDHPSNGAVADSHDGVLAWLRERLFEDRSRLVLSVGVLAAVVVAVRTTLRILVNLPFNPVAVPPAVRSSVAVAMPAVVAVALAVVALTDDRAPVRVGLLFAAVFGVIGLLAPAATLPAVVAVAAGGGLALFGALGRPGDQSGDGERNWGYRALRRRIIAGGFVTGVAVSLASAVGLLPGFRGVGGLVTLASLAAVGTRSERSPLAAAVGVLAAVGVVYVSATSPFVVGAALLVAFAVTGVPHLLVALAVAGGVAATIAGLGRGEYALATGATLLLLAGVPASLPRAMTVVLGASLVVLQWDQGVSP